VGRLADCVLYSVKRIRDETDSPIVKVSATVVGVAYIPLKCVAKALVFSTNVLTAKNRVSKSKV